MAQLQSTGITGSFNLYNLTPDTGSAGNWWYNPGTGR